MNERMLLRELILKHSIIDISNVEEFLPILIAVLPTSLMRESKLSSVD